MSEPRAVILKGQVIAERLLQEASRELLFLKKKNPSFSIELATIRIGESKDTLLYARFLKNLLSRVGIKLNEFSFPASVSQKKLIAEIKKQSKNPRVTGLMVFSPLPKKFSHSDIFEHIPMLKDVEGRTFLKSHFGVFSPTANAAITMVDASGVDVVGKEAVVVGHSDLVGKPIAALLMDRHATVTVCQKLTRDLKFHVTRADILISAAGKAHLISGGWVRRGALVVDIGENVRDGKILGDVEFEGASRRASFITPVPGGVGPVTNVMLIKNLIRLHKRQQRLNGNR